MCVLLSSNSIQCSDLISTFVDDTIPGSSLQEIISGTIVYSLPCNTTMQLNLTFGSVSAILTEAQLVRNLGNSTCVGVLEAWASKNATDYLLGASLISNIYLFVFISSSSWPH